MDGSSLLALAELLQPPEEERDSDDDLDKGISPYATPGSIGPPQATATPATIFSDTANFSDSINPKSSKLGEETSTLKLVEERSPYDRNSDLRPQPEYDMVFRQAVSAEDVFLGMGLKNPTTASCEELVVKIQLPGTDVSDVDLDVTETFLDCHTRKFRLSLSLPHKVANRHTKAKWISDKETLEVILKLNREFDFANFDQTG